MLNTGFVLCLSFGYMGLLFAVAYYGDRRAEQNRSVISNPYIYALSLAVYCTAWTFYGSVGMAVHSGPGFLAIYLGPTLAAAIGAVVLKKTIRICKVYRITSIADFIASRYGKSTTLGGVVTLIAVTGIVPYMSLQLKAISASFLLVSHYSPAHGAAAGTALVFYEDTAFYVAMLLAVFAILFGTRHLDTTERHEGLVAAIAFESVLKLIAFLAAGFFVTYVLFRGGSDIFTNASALPDLYRMWTFPDRPGVFMGWWMYLLLSMMSVLLLPRQFQMLVVENVNEAHLNKAVWLFPLYLLLINFFVIPVAAAGHLVFSEARVDADTYVLALPLAGNEPWLALLVYLGGMSAATGMVIVETIALSNMICNNLVIPVLLKIPGIRSSLGEDVSRLPLRIRRWSIVLLLLLGYQYYHFIGGRYPLVPIGLVSFVAVSQFAPSFLGGMYWKDGTRSGALFGLCAGFMVWVYTLVLPSLSQAGLLPGQLVKNGPFGVAWLRPYSLLGLDIGMFENDHIAHAFFWSLLINCSVYVGVSLFTRPKAMEHSQAVLFVDVFAYSFKPGGTTLWRGAALVPDLKLLLIQFLGRFRAEEALSAYGRKRSVDWDSTGKADVDFLRYVETLLAGIIGSTSARVLVASVVKEEPLSIEEVMDILNETRQAIAHSRVLEKVTEELTLANQRLKELDHLKDEFISTVTHELRTPLASIHSISEILHDHPDIDASRRKEFSAIIIKESRRLTRLINQVLDFQKIESGAMEWRMTQVNMIEVIHDAVLATSQLVKEKRIGVHLDLPPACPMVNADRDGVIQVLVNLLSNSVKFCPEASGRIIISLIVDKSELRVNVADNGVGIAEADQAIIFEAFRQVAQPSMKRPAGSGLGLSIAHRIIRHHGGRIWLKSELGGGTVFSFTLPISGQLSSVSFDGSAPPLW